MLSVKGKPAPVYLIYWEKESRTFSLIEYDSYQAPRQKDGERSPDAKPCHTQKCVQRLCPSSPCTSMLSEIPEYFRGTFILSTHSCYLQSFADVYNHSSSLPFPLISSCVLYSWSLPNSIIMENEEKTEI